MTIEEAQLQYHNFTKVTESVMLGTVDSGGNPNVSYAPFIIDEDKKIYIFVSGMSAHTNNINETSKVSVMFIEDEMDSGQIFARRRLTYECSGILLEKDNPEWKLVADKFEQRFGNIIDTLRNFPDFRIFQLTPQKGLFVIGFGAAYRINGDNLNSLVHITGSGHGHSNS